MFKAGFGRANINPMMGIELDGYYVVRNTDGVLDDLEVNAVSFSFGDDRQVFVSADMTSIDLPIIEAARALISKRLGIDGKSVHIGSTHTHTAPKAKINSKDPLIRFFTEFLITRISDAVSFAISSEKPAKIGYGVGIAPRIAFSRRFRMKDGSIRTNPGVGNPDILEAVGNVDERVGVLRIDREGAETIVFMNFANHPDTIGGCKVSADWPGFARRTVEKALDNTVAIFFNGAEGDLNHINVFPTEGEKNDLQNDFDDVVRAYGHSRYMGRVVAGAVLQTYDKVTYVPVSGVFAKTEIVRIPSNRPTPEQLPEAIRINELHKAGRDGELPYTGMELTTAVAEADRMVELMDGPDYFDMPMTAVSFGKVGFVTIPGEAFNEIGVELKKADGYESVFILGLTDESVGYFPTRNAYSEGGYESRSSKFREGVDHIMIKAGKDLLSSLNGGK